MRGGGTIKRCVFGTVAAAALICVLMGCATQRPARLPGETAESAQSEKQLPVVAVGAAASAKLRSGKTVSGEVTAVTDSSVTLGRVGNYGYEEYVALARDIVELRAEDRSSPAYGAGAAASVLIGLVAVGAIALLASMGHIASN